VAALSDDSAAVAAVAVLSVDSAAVAAVAVLSVDSAAVAAIAVAALSDDSAAAALSDDIADAADLSVFSPDAISDALPAVPEAPAVQAVSGWPMACAAVSDVRDVSAEAGCPPSVFCAGSGAGPDPQAASEKQRTAAISRFFHLFPFLAERDIFPFSSLIVIFPFTFSFFRAAP